MKVSYREILLKKLCNHIRPFVERCEELLNVKTPVIYEPPHVRHLVETKVDILDPIVVSNADPSLSLAELESHKEEREKTEANFTIVTRDSSGGECYYKDDQIKINISTSVGDHDQLETEVKDTKDGKYTVTYTPQCVGQNRVEIQINGEPLAGSPRVLDVIPHQYQFAFGSNGKKHGKLDIAVNDKSKMLAVADYENERIQMFRFDGEFLGEVALQYNTIQCSLF